MQPALHAPGYGLPHLEEGYFQKRYPFARRADGSGCEHNVEGQDGCGVGPFWKYFQTRATFQTPWEDEGTGTYKREPMAGGGDNWFGAYTDQWLLDYMQNRLYWDDEQGAYVRYDAETGEFVIDEGDPDNWYERPEQRDVPVYTLFGSYSDTVEEVRVIQPPLHYRGHLRRVMDPTNPEHIQWLKDNPGKVCGGGCDFAIRAIFEGGVERNFLINRSSSQFVRWAINVPDEGKLTRAELYRRDLRNGGGGNIDSIDAATYFDAATLVASRDF